MATCFGCTFNHHQALTFKNRASYT